MRKKRFFITISLAISMLSYASEGFHYFSFTGKEVEHSNLTNYIDTSSTLLIDDILKVSSKFDPNIIWVSDTSYTYWYRFTTEGMKLDGEYFLQANFRQKFLELYVADSKNHNINRLGPVYFSFNSWNTFNKRQILNVPKLEGATYYVKIKPAYLTPISFTLYDKYTFINKSIVEYLFNGLYFGIMLIIIIYFFVMFFVSNELLYFFYSMYILCMITMALVSWELLALVWPYSFKDYVFYNVPFSLMTICLLAYFIAFSAKKTQHKIAYALILGLIALRITLEILALITNNILFSNKFIDVFIIGVVLLLEVTFYNKIKRTSDFFFLGGFFVAFIGYVLHATYTVDEASIFERELFYYAGIVDVTFFAFAQAYRYREVKKNQLEASNQVINQLKINEELKDKVNRELEEKVLERTQTIFEQNQEIERMNELLRKHNSQLKVEVTTISKDRVMQNEMSFEDFQRTYTNDDDCYKFLVDLKWNKGFVCKKCGSKSGSDGYYKYSKRCNKCGYIETAASHTVFHNVKFPLQKAFYIMFITFINREITSDELSRKVKMRSATCYNFKQKVLSAIKIKKVNKDSFGWKSYVLD